MNKMSRNKSRTRLYNLMAGAKEITGAAGQSANWTILFPNLAAATDTYIVGGYYFQFVADGSEDYTTAGSLADPVLVTIGGTPTATTAAANLVTALHAFAGTAAWGFLYPDDSVGASSSTGTVTINFWPGTQADAATYITEVSSVGTNATITNVSDGAVAPTISPDYKVNVIDTTGSAINQEYYTLADGSVVGETASILVKTFASGDTPTILGNMKEDGVAMVEAEFVTSEPGAYVDFIWDGAYWSLAAFSALMTVPNFTASA